MSRTVIGLIVALIVIAGGWLMFKGTPAQAPVSNEIPAVTDTVTEATTTPSSDVTVTYGPQGFSPSSVTIPLGATVHFENQGDDEMWVASDPHPTHQRYDGTAKNQHCVTDYTGTIPFDQCSAGTVYSFTFTKAGTWGYHNHGNATDWGTVIVTAAQ